MAKPMDKKESAERSALWIADQLKRYRGDISERQWTVDARVSPSFFSNLRGTPTKPPSDPSVDQLRRILKVRGATLSEFFLPEVQGASLAAKSRQAVEKAFADALAGMPTSAEAQPPYLAAVVQRLLELPAVRPATEDSADHSGEGDPEVSAPPQKATRRK